MRKTHLYTICVALILSGVIACSSNQVGYLGLMDKGVLPLSAENAFLGANIFLAREMEKDDTLMAFFRSHGAPSAIELKSNTFKSDQLILYYAHEGSFYNGNPVIDEYNSRHWIFRGPYKMPWYKAKKMQPLVRNKSPEAVFYIRGEYQRFNKDGVEDRHIVQVILPTPVKTPTPKPVIRKRPKWRPQRASTTVVKATSTPTPAPELNPLDFQKLNADQRALLMAKGFAPRAENGDVIHIVKREDETLAAIGSWYTGSSENASTIATQNGLSPDAILSPGNQIRVPLHLLKNDKFMPHDYK